MDAVALLQIRQFFGQKKIFLLVLFLAIPIGLSGLVRAFGDLQGDGLELGMTYFLFFLYSQCVVPLLALLYGTGILNSELEGKTLTYLTTRPIAKWKIVASKYAAISACLLGAVLLSLLVSWILLKASGGARLFLGLAASSIGATLVYTAVFAALGSFFQKRPMIIGIVIGVVEFAISFIPALARRMTVTHFLRSLALRIIRPPHLEEIQPLAELAELGPSIAVVAGVIVLALGVAAWVASTREYVMAEQV